MNLLNIGNRFLIHHGTRHITGRIALLNNTDETPLLAELILDEPLLAGG